MDLKLDKRWQRFHDSDWICPCCNQQHNGIFDLGCDKPDYWEGSDKISSNSDVLNADNIWTEDFCKIENKHFFVRCVLEIPIIGSDEKFCYGIWSSLSKKNFDLYLESFDDGKQSQLGPFFGWFSNRLKGYPDTLKLECQVYPRDGRTRPAVELIKEDHPLAIAQQNGITFDGLLDIYALYGHDIRAALAQ